MRGKTKFKMPLFRVPYNKRHFIYFCLYTTKVVSKKILLLFICLLSTQQQKKLLLARKNTGGVFAPRLQPMIRLTSAQIQGGKNMRDHTSKYLKNGMYLTVFIVRQGSYTYSRLGMTLCSFTVICRDAYQIVTNNTQVVARNYICLIIIYS